MTDASSTVVLLVHGKQAKPVAVSAHITFDALKSEFAKAYPEQINFLSKIIFQIWSDDWDCWIDADLESNPNVFNKCKVRVIEPENSIPKLGNLSSDTCAFLCCDMQERFKPAINYFDEITVVANRLLMGAYLLDIPVIVTEQYPKGLLHTVAELDISKAKLVAEKTKFSMIIPQVEACLEKEVKNLQSVVLFGVEAHVCIQQTALDLLSRGIEVHIVADACSSRSQVDRHLAYERLQRSGAIVTTGESILLQLVKDKNHPKFKEVQGLIKVNPPDTGVLKFSSNI